MAYQKGGISLEEAQEAAYIDFIEHNEKSALLPDIIDTIHSGLPMILDMIKRYRRSGKIIFPRLDADATKNNIQMIVWKKMTLRNGIETPLIVEGGYNPENGRAFPIIAWCGGDLSLLKGRCGSVEPFVET